MFLLLRHGVLFASLLFLIPRTHSQSIELAHVGTYQTGIFDDGGSEIVAFDSRTNRLFSVNAGDNSVDVIDLSVPSNPTLLFTIDMEPYGGAVNSVDAYQGIVATAVENENRQLPGRVVTFDADGNYLNEITVGSLPDMLTFALDGRVLIVASEGEPDDDYLIDPDGMVSIIEVGEKGSLLKVDNLDFTAFNGQEDYLRNHGIRIYGPGASVSQDLEPEYVAVSDDNSVAFVTLQENNAVAIIDLEARVIKAIRPFGYKDHAVQGNGLDPSDEDGGITIGAWPVYGMYQPDAIVYFASGGTEYLLTANEGDARDYDGFAEEERIGDMLLDSFAFPDAADLQLDQNLGRLNATTALGDTDGDGDYDELYVYGGRSFSIWDLSGNLVYDSGEELEQITAAAYPDDFNSNNDENDSFESRSDNKGPEPEGAATGIVDGVTYAFIGLERIGGVAVFDLTIATAPTFVQYVNTRDFGGDPEAGTAGDLGPEGIEFVAEEESPTGIPLLIVGNEVSGSVSVFEIRPGAARALNAGAELHGFNVPEETGLLGNYPNPFNPSTTIGYTLSEEGHVSLRIFNTLGQEVAMLVDGFREAGVLTSVWDGTSGVGTRAPSGTYFYRLESGGIVTVGKMILTK